QLLIQVVFELAAAAWMAQLAQSLGLDLANTLTSHVKLFTNLFQSATATIVQTKAQLQNLTLTLGQAIKNILHLLFEQLMAGCLGRCQGSVVLDKVTQVTILFLTDRRLQAHRFLADLDDLTHLLRTNLHLCSNLFGRGFTPQVLQQATTNTDQAIDRLHHVYGDTNRARLVSDSTSDSLANPPGRIRTKLVPL